jgi:aminoglycoside phosphotransferase (APT) family kinase protein
MDDERPGLRGGRLRGDIIAGGKSNLTYRITDGASVWVLRRPPLSHVLATAHDMVREYRVIEALYPTGVPVAEPIALCTDATVLGAPFYLMSFIDGIVLSGTDTLARLDKAEARSVCEQVVDTLVELHAIAPDRVGLGEFGRPDGFLERQLGRWKRQWEASETEPRPLLGRVLQRLEEGVPEQPPPTIIHGDYRLANVMFRADLSKIAAVVDWEMATTGDPFTDLGLLVVYQRLAAEPGFPTVHMSPQDGFLTASEIVERYLLKSHRETDRLSWYVGFGYFKLAVIFEGIHARYLQGTTVGPGFDHLGAEVPGLLDAALESLESNR